MVLRLASCLALPYASSVFTLSCIGVFQGDLHLRGLPILILQLYLMATGISLPIVGIALRTLIVW